MCRASCELLSLVSSRPPTLGLVPGEGHRAHAAIPASPCTTFSVSPALMTLLCLARRAGHGPALGCSVSHPAWGDEPPCPSLASGSLCTHSPVWLGRALSYRCPSLCLLSCAEPAAGGMRRCSCLISVPTVRLSSVCCPVPGYHTGTGWDSWGGLNHGPPQSHRQPRPTHFLIPAAPSPSAIFCWSSSMVLRQVSSICSCKAFISCRSSCGQELTLSQLPQDGTWWSSGKGQEGDRPRDAASGCQAQQGQFHRAGMGHPSPCFPSHH